MLVSGYAGIGKSALVQELYKPLTAKRGYLSGVSLTNLGAIFLQRDCRCPEKLVQQLLGKQTSSSSDRACLRHWESNGQIIIDVIPEVELIIGKPPVPEVEQPKHRIASI